MPALKSIKDLTLKELQELMRSRGEPAFRARQVFSWLYRRGVSGFGDMTDLKSLLRDGLSASFLLQDPVEAKRLVSVDGTVKYALRLDDGPLIESVIIFDANRRTLCLSSQAGCARGCRICATAAMGFKRDLTQGEILNQIIHANRLLAPDRITHLVFMGMGEPMDNLDNVMAALKVIHDDHGFCISPKRVTVSTVGVLEGIRRLSEEGAGEGLAVSLHASTDEVRARLVPGAQKTSIREILAAAKAYAGKTGEKVTFEYVLIQGVNCLPEDGRRLASLLSALPSKLNLIPCNPARGSGFKPPSEGAVQEFLKPVLETAVIVTRRKAKGADIAAACGQLAA